MNLGCHSSRNPEETKQQTLYSKGRAVHYLSHENILIPRRRGYCKKKLLLM